MTAIDFSTSFVYILAVTINSLLMMVIGSWITKRFQKGGLRFGFANKTRIHKKFWGFVLFIIAIFLVGYLSSRLLSTLQTFLTEYIATSIIGIIITIVVAWLLYDKLVWSKHNS